MKTLLTIKRNIGWVICLMLTMGTLTSFGQQSVTGKVTSSDDGQGIPGVSVVVKGTTKGTTTDATGNYKIAVPAKGSIRSEERRVGKEC